MCGIGGFYKGSVGGETPTTLINNLWCSLENRGTHAAGIVVGWGGSDAPVSKKAAKSASECSKMLNLAKGSNTQYVLLHTRYTTQGSTKNNGNNHPVIAHGITLTHNGVLSNDKQIFSKLGVKRVHQVDTEAINAALTYKSPKWMIENIMGSMSLAWVETKENVNKVHLLTNGRNPLVIGRTKSNDIVWASTKTHLEQSGFDFVKIFDAIPYKQYTISEGGRISSTILSKKTAYPANNRQVHSSQSQVTSEDWDTYFNATYGRATKATPANDYEWESDRVLIPKAAQEDVEDLMWDLGYQLTYDSRGRARFELLTKTLGGAYQ